MTIFISALPIATALAFVYNCYEIKLDAWKLLMVRPTWNVTPARVSSVSLWLPQVYQRPIPKIAEDWGAWGKVFSLLAVIGVITNAALICFTMTTLDHWSYANRIWSIRHALFPLTLSLPPLLLGSFSAISG
jgi:hypothetical protein